MNHPVRLALTLLISVGALSTGGGGPTVIADSLDADRNLIIGARSIVRGRVKSVGARLEPRQDRVFTYIRLEVEETLKGEILDPEIVLKEEGGETAERGELIFGSPRFKVGERILAYLDTWPDGSLRVYQMCLGKFTVDRHSNTGAEILVRDTSDREPFLFRSATTQHSPLASTFDAADHVRLIKRTLRQERVRVEEFYSRHYEAVPINAWPPEYDAFSGSDEIEPTFSLLPIPARWFQPDQGEPITFLINPDRAPNPQAVEDVGAAIDAWAKVPGISAHLVNGGGRSICNGTNGFIAVTFNNCDGRFQEVPGCDRIIARGGIVWDNRILRQTNGQEFRKALRGFVSLNPYSRCSYENHCDLREVVTHEIGHALGLGHSNYPEATMYGSAHSDGRCATLRTDDAKSLAFVYPSPDPGPRPLQITTTTLSEGVVGSHFVQVLEAEGGRLPYMWTAVPGAGRPPEGLTVVQEGGIIGDPMRPEISSFLLEVIDANGASATRRFSMTIFDQSSEYESQFVSQSIPSVVQVSQQFNAVIRWLNTGTRNWDSTAGFSVTSQYPSNNITWGISRIVPVGQVQPTGHFEARFTVTAPSRPGAYDFEWQLHQEGIGIFGKPSASLTVFVYPALPPTIDGPQTLQPIAGMPFSHRFTINAGTPPFTWSIATGRLPTGLALNSSTGEIAGTPDGVGTSTITIQVTDGQLQTAQKQVSIDVVPQQFGISTTSLPGATVGAAYTAMLSAFGGVPPYAWSVTSGTLPAGLSLEPQSGMIHGTPAAAGTSIVGFTARDQVSRVATVLLELSVSQPQIVPSITSAKYKSRKGKLIVVVERADPQALLLIDGAQVSARLSGDRLIAKRLTLSAGVHEIRVLNPGGATSLPFVLNVN